MGVEDSPNSNKVLEGVHGMRLLPQSPFKAESVHHHGVYNAPSAEPCQNIVIQRIWEQRPTCLRPICCDHQGDRNLQETVVNVMTSLPFIAIGLRAPRNNLNSRLYANSLVGVGIASSLYHSSRGKLKRFFRWADYAMISAATICLSRALGNENPRSLMMASAFILPFQPFMVSAVHTGLMEVTFAKRALEKPELRRAHNIHAFSSLLAGACFVADDCFPQTPYIHAAWHLAAAVSTATCNKLLE
ncbi:uncharacterized protein LOC144713855 [Wolffia australiana]